METTRTDWQMVEALLAELAVSGAPFASATSQAYRIESYAPGWRVRMASVSASRWIDIEDIQACWSTFERLQTISKDDLLEPGRASSFMFALFGQLSGTVESDDGASLALA